MIIEPAVAEAARSALVWFALATPFLVAFAVTQTPSWTVVVGANLAATPLIRGVCGSALGWLADSTLAERDVVYMSTLMTSQLSVLASAGTLIATAFAYSDSVAVQKVSIVFMTQATTFAAQEAALSYITAKHIWVAYLTRIRRTVAAYTIVQGFHDFVAESKIGGAVATPVATTEPTVDPVEPAAVTPALDEDWDDDGMGVSLRSVHRSVALTQQHGPCEDPGSVYDAVLRAFATTVVPTSPVRSSGLTGAVRLIISPPKRRGTLAGEHHALTGDHILEIFEERAPSVMRLLDKNNNGVIDKHEFVAIFNEIRSNSANLRETLQDFRNITRTLNRALSAFSALIVFFVSLVVLGFNILQNSVLIVSVFVAASIAFGSSLQRFFEGIIFVFGSRPYDVGDRVQMLGMDLLVKNISLLNTHAVCSDGRYTILSNSLLKDSVIVNVYRSQETTLSWRVAVPCGAPHTVCAGLERFLAERRKDATATIECAFDTVREDGRFDVVSVVARLAGKPSPPVRRRVHRDVTESIKIYIDGNVGAGASVN
jgi:hypothetical protein